MVKVWNKFARWPVQLGVAMLLVGTLARPAAAGTTYSVSTVAQLEAAIVAVNAGTGGDLIMLAPGFYSVTTGLTRIFQDVTIQGDPLSPTVIAGDGSFTIFDVSANNVTFRDLTIQDGYLGISYQGYNQFSGTGLTLTGNGIGLYLGDNNSTSFLTNSTLVNNTFGIQVDCAGLNVTNATITGNQVGLSFSSCGEQMLLTNTLVVANGRDCDGGGITPVANASFDSDGTCVDRGFAPELTTVALPALDLGPLASNGGPTQTVAISATSVAVNAGFDPLCPATDQRGFRRGSRCDIGAYESGAGAGGGNTPAGTITVSPAPGVSLTFDLGVTTGGDTTATTGGPAPPTGFQADGPVYDISTTAGFAGDVTVCLPYNAVNNLNPRLYHYEAVPPPGPSPNWVDKTTYVDALNSAVCGRVQSLSPFAVLMRVDIDGQLQQLQALVESFNLRKPVARRFIHRVDKVRDAWTDTRHHKHSARKFCTELDKFMRNVRKATGRTLTAGEAGQLLALSQEIASAGGCTF